MKKTALLLFTSLVSLAAVEVIAAEDHKPARKMEWSFDGMFGKVDKQAAQRGFQVYKEVCSACHSMNRVAFRQLTDLGFSEAEVKALAATYQVTDGPNDQGAMFQRPGKPSDTPTPPHANEQEARAAHNGAYPPDFSLLLKARHDGANYIYSLLTGYAAAPADVKLADGQYYNPYIAGERLAMPPPLTEGSVTYADGTQATVDQMARDVVNFMQWAAEPEMEARKEMGVKVLIFLAIFTVFMYLAKRNLWKKLH